MECWQRPNMHGFGKAVMSTCNAFLLTIDCGMSPVQWIMKSSQSVVSTRFVSTGKLV